MKWNSGIRFKIIQSIGASIFMVALIGMIIGYSNSYFLMKNVIIQSYEKISDSLAFNVVHEINDQLAFLQALSKEREWIDAVEKASPEYVDNPVAQALKLRYLENGIIDRLSVYDRFGLLIAATSMTEDIAGADQTWWEESFSGGSGKAFIGDARFDHLNQTWIFPLAVPIKDSEGSVIGIIKADVSAERFFASLVNLYIGRTGHTQVINQNGDILFPFGANPYSHQFLESKDFQSISQGKARYLITSHANMRSEKMCIVFSDVRNPLLEGKAIWRIGIVQSAKEIFLPLRIYFFENIGLAILLMVLIPVAGAIFGRRLIKPIERLKEASERIAHGEVVRSINLHTNDELEELARSFQSMSVKLKEREERLVKENAILQGTIASITDFLILTNSNFRINLLNKSFLDILGYTEAELIGKPIETIFSELEGEKLNQYLQAVMKQSSTNNVNLTILTKKNELIPVIFNGAALREEGVAVGMVGIAHDMRPWINIIDDLENKEKKLKEYNKKAVQMQRAMLHIMGDLKDAKDQLSRALGIKTEFARMISHELRTPLTAIKEGVSVVLDQVVGNINDEQQKYLAVSKGNVDRLDRLICSILDFQKFESGKMPFYVKKSDLNKVVQQTYNTMEPVARKQNLFFTLQLEEDLPLVSFDEDKICQVLTNLMNNALKFTQQGGITITVARKDHFVQVTVRDTGLGIQKEDMGKLFQPFTQLQKNVKGTGLGLAICRQIIEAHKGKIWAESEFRKGSAFHFTLPITE
jgi:PAS domain S-box-containing protein